MFCTEEYKIYIETLLKPLTSNALAEAKEFGGGRRALENGLNHFIERLRRRGLGREP